MKEYGHKKMSSGHGSTKVGGQGNSMTGMGTTIPGIDNPKGTNAKRISTTKRDLSAKGNVEGRVGK